MSAVISREDIARVRDRLRERADRNRSKQAECTPVEERLWGLYGGWADASDCAADSLDFVLGEDTRPDVETARPEGWDPEVDVGEHADDDS